MSTSKQARTRGEDYEAPTPVPKTQRTRGRPSDFEPSMVADACDLIRQGATDKEVCDELGIGVTTFWRWREQYPEFRKAVELAKGAQDDRVEASLHRVANEGNVTAQIFWLKNRRPEQWRDRKETELIVPVNDDAPEDLDARTTGLAMLALLNEALYTEDEAAGPLIEMTANAEEQDDGERSDGTPYLNRDDEAGSPGDFDPDFDLDPGEV